MSAIWVAAAFATVVAISFLTNRLRGAGTREADKAYRDDWKKTLPDP